jgi:hypothetical protein
LESLGKSRHRVDGELVDPSKRSSLDVVLEVTLSTHRLEVDRLATMGCVRPGVKFDITRAM